MFRKKLAGTQTYNLLKEAFMAECYAEMRFKLFASIARNEGLPAISDVFNDLAHSQNTHAVGYFNILRDAGGVYYGFKTGNTIENIKTALETEALESDACAGLIKVATDEGLIAIAEQMEEVALAELGHIHRLNSLSEQIM